MNGIVPLDACGIDWAQVALAVNSSEHYKVASS